ncbi:MULTISPECIES: TetR/AcrR family transcriptional regulator [Streptomyces]|uniref:TetR/AcrR family transcriptional regulator n=1 Tax=Streptomyces caniscabiei TaxID=2746961 RepID=A0ABU4N2P0_9ACTN|nr:MULTISPECIES: TetR/AcrR family transcriptional regulator [Streptomyces]MBE4734260.1 TetR/AcrR family transcriptional regulator [Streptomyces caniscabiei]MBE4755131.1 TetR/AcrR family transcriptional regulator [Streptomyces caniscabiei]MBE4771110.1 TetR/AcrR family transcriptional regulator [Streptomyces caniscabiei]MBE4783584.1 TetR/AcrR family transcriptional regulator [Streptomyces caniscabiei]MBE4792888.1 TetR/AcrR family transcriptional regulator [Streptomyces caniscabiei]
MSDEKRPGDASEPVVATRERIARAASRLMQRQGYDGTGIKQISAEAGATLGSVYHFFPGGKLALAVEALHRGDREFVDELRAVFDEEEDPASALVLFTRRLAEGLRASDWRDGCPVTTTGLGASGRYPQIQAAASEAFARWHALVLDKLTESGVAEDDARALAHTVISILEGAELTAQMTRSEVPLEAAGRHLALLIDSARGTAAGPV